MHRRQNEVLEQPSLLTASGPIDSPTTSCSSERQFAIRFQHAGKRVSAIFVALRGTVGFCNAIAAWIISQSIRNSV
eukprot:1380670-Amphidinium_carterae.1